MSKVKTIYVGKPYIQGDKTYHVEFTTNKSAVLSCKVDNEPTVYLLLSLSELFSSHIDADPAKHKSIQKYGDKPDIKEMITVFEELAAGDPMFWETISVGFHNLKRFSSLDKFLEYCYETPNLTRQVLCTIMEHSKLLYPVDNSTYFWTSSKINQNLIDFVLLEKSIFEDDESKFILQYLTLVKRVEAMAVFDTGIGVNKLNAAYKSLEEFEGRFKKIKFIDLSLPENAEKFDLAAAPESFWHVDRENEEVLGLAGFDYEVAIMTTEVYADGDEDGVT